MTYYITALENTKARLIDSESRTSSEAICKMIVAEIEARGLIAIVRVES